MRILFVTATRIGDAVLSTGLLAHLIERNPGARVTVACGSLAAPLFSSVPGLERLIEIEKQSFKAHWISLWLATVGRRWDVVVDLRASGLGWFLRSGKLYVKRSTDQQAHRVVDVARLLEIDTVPDPEIWLGDADLTASRDRQPDNGPVLAIGPTANWAAKEWPAERFAALAQRLTSEEGALAGARIAIHGAEDERERAKPVFDIAGDRAIDLMGAALPIAAGALQRSTIYVGNDSGLMHLSAAAGTPTLGLFGPTSAANYAPWGEHTAICQTEIPREDLVSDPDFNHLTSGTLMESLSVDTVVTAAERLLKACADR